MNSIVLIFALLTFNFTTVQLRIVDNDVDIIAEANLIRAHSGCDCEDRCTQGSGTYNVSCEITGAVYFSCKQSSCRVESCPIDQVYNERSSRCESCEPGLHFQVRSSGKFVYCGCALGTTYSPPRDHCVTCSSDSCYCNGLGVDATTNECRKCPNNTLTGNSFCQCLDPIMVFSLSEFTCKECPGIMVEIKDKGKRRSYGSKYECQCEGGKVLNEWLVTCVSCPPDSVYENVYEDYYGCRCLKSGQYYDRHMNRCE